MYPDNDVTEIAQCTVRDARWEKKIKVGNPEGNRAHSVKWKE
jgi:hypothetical protein